MFFFFFFNSSLLVLCCLSSSLYFFPVSLCSSRLHSSLSRVPLKDIHERRAAIVERVRACLHACPAITLRYYMYASVFLFLLFLSDPVWVETSSLPQSDWICIFCVCVCVRVCNLGAVPFLPLKEITFESKTMGKSK